VRLKLDCRCHGDACCVRAGTTGVMHREIFAPALSQAEQNLISIKGWRTALAKGAVLLLKFADFGGRVPVSDLTV